MSSIGGAVNFQTYWETYTHNGGGCFSNEFIKEYLAIVLDKKEEPQIRCEVFQSLLHTPVFKASYVIDLLSNIVFDDDDVAKNALSDIRDWIISSLRFYLPQM